MIGGAHPKRIRLVGRRLPGILPASVRCDGLHEHAQDKFQGRYSRVGHGVAFSPFYNEIAHAVGRQLGRALNSHFPHCAPFDMQSSVTQAAFRQPRGVKSIPRLSKYLQIITTEVSGERAAALLAYIRKNPSGEDVPHGATLLLLLDHRSNIWRSPILAPIRIHVSSFLNEGYSDMIYMGRWHRARCGRVLVGSKCTNPFKVNKSTDINMCLHQFRRYLWSRRDFPQCLGVLAGKRNACHCDLSSPCHVDVFIDEFSKFFKHAHGPYTAVWVCAIRQHRLLHMANCWHTLLRTWHWMTMC